MKKIEMFGISAIILPFLSIDGNLDRNNPFVLQSHVLEIFWTMDATNEKLGKFAANVSNLFIFC